MNIFRLLPQEAQGDGIFEISFGGGIGFSRGN